MLRLRSADCDADEVKLARILRGLGSSPGECVVTHLRHFRSLRRLRRGDGSARVPGADQIWALNANLDHPEGAASNSSRRRRGAVSGPLRITMPNALSASSTALAISAGGPQAP